MSSKFEGKNYYEILGVAKDASKEEIRLAYKDIARVFHPDSNFYDEILEFSPSDTHLATFKLLTEAYNTLVNEKKRAEYDRSLPPELRSWESHFKDQQNESGVHEAPSISEHRKRKSTTRDTFKTFGVVDSEKGPLSDVDGELSNGLENPMLRTKVKTVSGVQPSASDSGSNFFSAESRPSGAESKSSISDRETAIEYTKRRRLPKYVFYTFYMFLGVLAGIAVVFLSV